MERRFQDTSKHFGWVQRLVCLVLACVITAGMLPVQVFAEEAAEKTALCEIVEHIHDESCYQRDLICPQAAAAAHTHTPACEAVSETPTCGLEEDAAHTAHAFTCGTLSCELEHTHEESCYDPSVLTCGFHIHGESCFGTVYICEESKVTDLDTHVHTDSCCSSVATLICTTKEHAHTLACYANTKADVETEADWTASLPVLTGDATTDLFAVAKSQLNLTNDKNKESELNYIVDADGVTKHGYTRYGAWFLDPYMDWNGAFLAFCLHYAGVNMSFNLNYDEWIRKLKADSLFLYSYDHTPVPGEIAFLHSANKYNSSDRVGIVAAVYPDNSVDIIVGDHNNAVATVNVKNIFSDVIGYGLLEPAQAEQWETQGSFGENNCLTWQVVPDGDGYILYIRGNGAIPAYANPGGTYEDSIKKVIIEDGVTHIGDQSLAYMYKLTEVEISGSVKTIGRDAFRSSSLVRVTIPEGVEEIGEYAFNYCRSLEEVTLPDSLKTLGSYAFKSTAIKSITIPNGIENWGNGVFSYCSNLESAVIEPGIEKIPAHTFSNCTSLVSVEIPDSVTVIERYAFNYCPLLDIQKLPDSLTTIGDYAFSWCGITSFSLPESVKNVGNGAFSNINWTSLTIPNQDISWGYNVFSSCNSLTEVTASDGVQEIPEGMFNGCINLTSVNLPNSVTTIKDKAFHETGFTSVTISDELTYGKNVYAGCEALETVIIEDGVTTIPEGVFSGCTALTTVELPDSVNSISSNAFSGCTALTSVELPDSVNSIGSGAFSGCTALHPPFKTDTYYTFPDGSASNTGFAAPLKTLSGDYYVDTDGILWQILENGNAKLCYIPSHLTNCTVPASIPGKEEGVTHKVTAVGSEALALATALEILAFEKPEYIVRLDDLAFANAPSLTSINGCTSWWEARKTFTNSDLTIGKDIFKNTKLYETVVLPEGEVIPGPLEITPVGDAPGVQIIANVSETLRQPSLREDGTYLCYTGEWATTQITVTNPNPDYRIRVYVQYSSSRAVWNRTVDSKFTILNADGSTELGYVTLLESELPGVYYYELASAGTDSVWDFTFQSQQPAYTAPGDTMRIWAAVMTKEESEILGSGIAFDADGHKYLSVEWGTQRDEYSFTLNGIEGEIVGSGLGDNTGRVSIVGFEGFYRLSRGFDVGRDSTRDITYRCKVMLPEGVSWDPRIAEAIQNGNVEQDREYYSLPGDSELYYYTISVPIGGQWTTIIRCLTPYYHEYHHEYPTIYFDGTDFIVEWSNSYYNRGKNYRVLFFDTFVVEDPNREISVGCQLDVDVTYAHSDPAEHTVTAQAALASTPANFDLTQTVEGSNYMGTNSQVTISAKNSGLQDHTGLQTLTGTLSTGYYLKPASMSELLAGSYDVTITIDNAKLCAPVSETVTGTDGQTQLNLSSQNTGTNTAYFGRASSEAAECIKAMDARITLMKTVDGVRITVDRTSDGSIASGDIDTTVENSASAIAAVLNSAGYLVTPQDNYIIYWDHISDNGEAFRLFGGQTRIVAAYTATCKDSFMLLGSDALSCLSAETNNQSIITYAYSSNGLLDADLTSVTINRDFTLNKYAFVSGKWTEYAETVSEYQTIPNRITISNAGGTKDILPVVERIVTGQELLVPVAQNPQLADKNLQTTWYRGMPHYRLNKIGETYYNVYVGGHFAHSVTVGTQETLVRWYFTNVSAGNLAIDYAVYTNYEDIALPDGVYRVSNETWLNDHQTHRLWNAMILRDANLGHNIHIVTSKGSSPLADTLEDFSYISTAEAVTYRLELLGYGNVDAQLNGSNIYMKLPAIVPPATSDDWCWSKANVSISYVTEGSVKLTNPNSWKISDLRPGASVADAGQYYICWDNDFTAKFTSTEGSIYSGKVYAYVTLTFPEGTQWEKYGLAYGGKQLEAAFSFNDMPETVTHELQSKCYPYLQVGVYTGVQTTADSPYRTYSRLHHDTNDRVTYYVTLYNSGGSRLYLNDFLIDLPDGFICESYYKFRSFSTIRVNGQTATFMDGNVKLKNNTDGYTVLEYSPYSSLSQNRYDSTREKYYLMPGEYIAFTFECSTNSRFQASDPAECKVYMPYYDYNSGGMEVAQNVTVTLPESDLLQNNGRCQMVEQNTLLHDADSETSGLLLASTVSTTHGNILPGVTTKPAGVIVVDSNHDETTQDYNGYAQPEQVIKWETTFQNHGLRTIYDYTITQTVEAPYSFTKEVRWDYGSFSIGERYIKDGQVVIPITESNKTFELILNGDPVTITNTNYSWITEICKVQIRTDENGNEILTFQVDNNSIYPSKSSTLTFYTQNLTDKASGGIHYSEVLFTPAPDQHYDGDMVINGHNVTDDQGKNVGVWNNSSFLVASDLATTAWMTVTPEIGNSVSSTADTRYTVLGSEFDALRYSMTVENERNTAIQQMVFINNLPAEGDHGPFSEMDKRFSDFGVALAENPGFTASMTRNGVTSTLDPSQYTIEYTTQTTFTQADWAGEADSAKWIPVQYENGKWTSTLPVNAVRAIRVILRNQSGTAILPGVGNLTVSYNAMIPENETVTSGETAWNSFGYQFTNAGSSFGLGAAPQSVGVRIPYVPTLTKELAFSNADAYTADAEECVTFQIYAGTSVNSTICTFATVTVPEGSSSAEITLDNLKVYRMVNGEWTVTDSNWTWANGTTYTVAEVNCGEDFYFGNFHNTTAQTFSFVYNPVLKTNIVCTNYAHDWTIELHKTDADDESIALPGAAFGLYSPVEADRVDIAAAKAAAGLDADVRVSAIKTYDGTVYYLTAIAVTDDMGNCQWNKLMEDSYIVAELQAPLGYVLDSTLHRIQRNGDETVTMTIENASGSAIPETGGAGIGLYMAAGTTLILASLCGAYLLWLKRRKQNA